MAEATKQPHLATVSIKLPLFWPSDPQLYMWLPQVQGQFSTGEIMNQITMFDNVIALLAPEFNTEMGLGKSRIGTGTGIFGKSEIL